MKIEIDDTFIHKYFSKEQIKRIMESHNFTYPEAVFYLMFFNYVDIMPEDVEEDMGTKMYEKFTRCISKYIKENK